MAGRAFQKVREDILAEMLQHDCLLVLARGLGTFELCYQFLSLYSRKECLVFVINMPKNIQQRLELELRHSGCQVPLRCITTDYSAEERAEEYVAGGCVGITSRLLAVDLLTGRVPASTASGMVVWDAHRISETSGEAFILRLFRQQNRTGFIKALSDAPEAFGGGFFRVEKVGSRRYVFIRINNTILFLTMTRIYVSCFKATIRIYVSCFKTSEAVPFRLVSCGESCSKDISLPREP
jgi:DNA excision repair protein ERCC-4